MQAMNGTEMFFDSSIPTEYSINNILKGYSNFEKLKRIYSDLRENIFTKEPLQVSPPRLVTINRDNLSRGGSYGWELHVRDSSLIVLEWYGYWTGHAHESIDAPTLSKADLYHLSINVHNSTPDLERRIEEIISKYPPESSN